MSALDSTHLKQDGADGRSDELNHGSLDDRISFNLRLAQYAVFQFFVRELGKEPGMHKILPGHATLMALISDNPGITQTALSKAAARDKSTLTPVLNDFAKRGLITRIKLENDRRSSAIYLTDKGRQFAERLHKSVEVVDAKLGGIVGEENREAFVEILREIKRRCED